MVTDRAGASASPASPHAGAPGSPAAAAVRLAGVHKQYPGVAAVAGVDLTVEAGGVFTLLGASRPGKTTLLRGVARVEPPDPRPVLLAGAHVPRRPPSPPN